MTNRLAGIDLVVFDKDGTLIEFHAMWSGWAEDLCRALETATGLDLGADLDAMLGYDRASGRAIPGGRLAATPMARLRDLTGTLLIDRGLDPAAADAALDEAWHAPDPVALARPVADLSALLTAVRAPRATGRRRDDRRPRPDGPHARGARDRRARGRHRLRR